MTHPTHQMIGLACALPVAAHVSDAVTGVVVVVGASVIGSLLPDADHADATIHQPTEVERHNALLWLVGWIVRLPLRLVALLPHRGPMTHGFPALVIVPDSVAYTSAVGGSLALLAVLGIAVGYLAHLLADGATVSGLPGYPFCRRVYTVPARLRVVTGSPGETRYMLVALFAFVVMIVVLVLGARQ
jgi:membrane-bound metal-dependent hydrolase YbcI (DUF457 family)